ncbi:MAG TPA: acetyl-CoA carboxylase biotin carboxyl carrier protein [bacterium]
MEKRNRSSERSEREPFKLIEDMLQLMEERGLVELEIEQEGLRIRLKRAGGGGQPTLEALPGSAQAPAAAAPASGGAARTAEEAGRVLIRSPMVGTFYRAPTPDSPPFTDADQEVEPGQVVCIIEAMKLMNEIKSEVSGRIAEVLAENGDPVEFGQPLFAVEPRA